MADFKSSGQLQGNTSADRYYISWGGGVIIIPPEMCTFWLLCIPNQLGMHYHSTSNVHLLASIPNKDVIDRTSPKRFGKKNVAKQKVADIDNEFKCEN